MDAVGKNNIFDKIEGIAELRENTISENI